MFFDDKDTMGGGTPANDPAQAEPMEDEKKDETADDGGSTM
jgi:hypothetical protein